MSDWKNRIFDIIEKILKWKYRRNIFYIAGFLLISTGVSLCTNIDLIYLLVLTANIVYKLFSGNSQNLIYYDNSYDKILGIIFIIIGCILMVLGKIDNLNSTRNKKKKKLVLLSHYSMGKPNFNIKSKLEKEYDLIQIDIDQTRFYKNKEIKISDIPYALDIQEDTRFRIGDITIKASIAYMGIAHIPFVFRLGYQIGDENSFKLFEKRKKSEDGFVELNDSNIYPKLILKKEIVNLDCNELILAIGITYPVLEEQIPILKEQSFCYFETEEVGHDLIKSYKQISEYKEQIREKIDEFLIKAPSLQKIHIFYAGQTSLAFRLGTMISETHDPDVFVYHFSRNHPKKYPWGLDIKEKDPTKSLIRIDDII